MVARSLLPGPKILVFRKTIFFSFFFIFSCDARIPDIRVPDKRAFTVPTNQIIIFLALWFALFIVCLNLMVLKPNQTTHSF